MRSQKQLFGRYAQAIKPGLLQWIGVRPAHKQPLLACERVQALQTKGLVGDHRVDKTPGSAR